MSPTKFEWLSSRRPLLRQTTRPHSLARLCTVSPFLIHFLAAGTERVLAEAGTLARLCAERIPLSKIKGPRGSILFTFYTSLYLSRASPSRPPPPPPHPPPPPLRLAPRRRATLPPSRPVVVPRAGAAERRRFAVSREPLPPTAHERHPRCFPVGGGVRGGGSRRRGAASETLSAKIEITPLLRVRI